MRALRLSLVILVAVHLTRHGASLSTSTEKTTTSSEEIFEVEEDDEESYDSGIPASLAESGKQRKYTRINMTIYQKRANESEDHPVFVDTPGTISVPDDLPVFSVLGKVKATDPTNQGRKCFYHLTNAMPGFFRVDTYTGVITTKKRLDTGENVGIRKGNVTEFKITISTRFHNFTDVYDRILRSEDVVIMVKVLHRSLRDLTQHSGQNGITITVAKSSWDGENNWIQHFILGGIFIIMVIVLVILSLITFIVLRINENPLAPSTCIRVVPKL